MKTIAAIIVTFNRKELLAQSIACLRNQVIERNHPFFFSQENTIMQSNSSESDMAPLTILVVDNASTDGTEESLRSLIDEGSIRYFNTGSNLGGAGGFNAGMRLAVEQGYDYLWVMDDDCFPEKDALKALLDADVKLGEGYGYLSSVVRWTDGSICKMNVQRHPLTKSIADFSPELQPVTLASFVSLFVPSRIVADEGLPIKEFFIWTDDWEFTRRISRRYPCYLVGGSVVVHASKTNGAGTIATDSNERLDRYRYIYRNDVVLYRREGLRGYGYLFARALYHLVSICGSKDGLRMKKCGIVVSATVAGFRFHPTIEYPELPCEDSL